MTPGASVEWSIAARPLPGEAGCGDRGIVLAAAQRALAAAVDGVGHGEQASLAADRAIQAVEAFAADDVVSVIEHCDRTLVGTRGAAISLASFDCLRDTITWIGVGNVEGALLRGTSTARAGGESLLLRSGVVGHELPPLAASTVDVRRGDLLVMATDGIDHAAAGELAPVGSCAEIASAIVDRCALAADDALVVVVRYLGARR